MNINEDKALTIAELYPDLSPEQQAEAEYFLHRYIDLISHIRERVEREGKSSRKE